MGECEFCIHVAKYRDQWLGSCEHSTEPHGSIKDEELILEQQSCSGFSALQEAIII
jgi:hypothetical protein